MDEKELLSAFEEITRRYGPQKKTFDEFKFQMQSKEYRKKVFDGVHKDVFGYDNFEQFNVDKFEPTPELEINDTPTKADNLPRFNGASSTFVDQSTDIARSGVGNPKTMGGGPGGNSRRISPRTQAIIDSNKEKKKRAEQQVALERAKKGAVTSSDLVTKGGSFEDVVKNYSLSSGENLLAGQLDYNDGKLQGIEKGQFEQKAINKISKDMFAIVDDTENSQVWKNHGDEYGFLINQLNSTNSQIKYLQDKLATTQDPNEVSEIKDDINDLLEEGAEISIDKKDEPRNLQLAYGSYNDMQERFQQLNSLPEFKNYQRSINILNKLRDVSNDFENRNPEFVQNQKELEKKQEYIDMQDKFDIPTFSGGVMLPNFLVDGVSKPIFGALAKGLREGAAGFRTLAFNNEYGWTDSFAEGAERMLSKEYSQNTLMSTGISSRKERGLFEEVAKVDDYQLTLTDNLFGDKTKTPKSVRDADGFIVRDPKIVKSVIEKYESNPEDYKSEGQWNYESALPTFTGVVADLGILMFGTKGIGVGVKGAGAIAKGTKVGNFLSKSTVANRIGLTAAVTGQTHNGLYEEAIRNGMSPAEASSFALTGSLVVAGIAQINPQFYLIGEKKAASELTKRYIEFLAKGETKKQSFNFAIREVFKQGGKEMAEELAEIPFLNATRYGFNQFLTPEKKFEIEWSRGEAVDSAIYGLAAGTGTGPMNISSQSELQQQATYSAYKAQDKFFKRTDDLVGKQYMDPESGDMLYYTKDNADGVKKRFSDLFTQMEKATVNTKKLSPETETELLSLIQRSNNIQDSMEGINYIPAVRQKLDKENAKIQDAITNIIDGNSKSIEEIVAESKTKKEADSKTEAQPVRTEQQIAEDTEFDKTFEDLIGVRPEVTTEENIEGEPKPKVEGDQQTDQTKTNESTTDNTITVDPVEVTNTKTQTNPKPVFTKDEVNTAKANNDYLTPLINTLKQNFPGVNVVVDEKAITDLAKKAGVTDAAAKGAKGVFNPANNTIIINPKTATKDTPIHEFGHVWSKVAETQRPELHKKGLELIKGSKIEQDLRARIESDPDQKIIYTEEKILDEALAIAIGQRGAKLYEDSAQQSKWEQYVKDVFDFIKQQFGIDPKQAIEDLTLREFIELASTEIITGEQIAPTEIKSEPEVKVDENGQTLLFQANFLDPETGFKMTYLKNEDKFKALEKQGFITRNKTINDYNDVDMVVHMPDFAFSGEISRNGNTLVEGKGGVYYPIKFHDKGYFWASTKSGADGLVKLLNESVEKSPDGKARMALVSSPPTKLLSSTTASNGVMELFTSKLFIEEFGVSEIRLKRALVVAANSVSDKGKGLNLGLTNNSTIDEVKSSIAKSLAADKSVFPARLHFVETFLDGVSKRLQFTKDGKKKKNTDVAKRIANFFTKPGTVENLNLKRGKLSKKNLKEAVSYMFGEPMLRSENQSGNVYAVLEVDGKVKPFETLDHESYPNAIVPVNKNNKVTLNILNKRNQWGGVFVDPQTNEVFDKIEKNPRKDQIIPTTRGLSTLTLKVKSDPKSEEQVSEADVVNESDLALFSLPTTNKITQEQVDEALSTDKTSQRILAKGINPKTGDNVGVRLNLNVFKNTKVPVQTVHKGSNTDNYKKVNGVVGNFRGEALTYKAAVTIKDAHFNTHQKSVYEVKNKIKNKFPLASVDGKYQEVPLDKQNYSGVEIGFNPMKNSLFVDSDGKPVKRADEVTIVGTKVYARGNVEYFTEENKPKEYSPSFQLDGKNPVSEDQINQVLQRAKDTGLDKAKVIDYLNRRFPDYTTERLSELYEGNVTPESDKPSANRKYTSRLAEVLSSETFEALSEDAKKYVPRSNQITDAEAQVMFDQLGVEESVKVIKQNPDYLLPEVRIALTNKVITELESEVQKLRDEGKLAESETISAGINGIVEMMTKEGTNSGRFIQAFRMLNALSADRTIALIEKQLEKEGKNPLTEEEKNKLKDLIKTEKAAAEGLPKSKAVAELYKYKMSILGASGKNLFEAYFYGAILSGITTQERNIVANLMSISSELIVTSVREAMKGNPKAIWHASAGMIKGLAKGWLNAKNIFKTGVRSARADKMDSPQLLEWWRFNTNSKVVNKFLNSPWYTLNPWSPNFLKYVNRGMVAFDQMFYHAAKDMQAYALASNLKRGKNVTPEDIRKANDILNPPKEYIEDAIKEAKTEGFEEGSTEFKIRVHELIEAKRDLTIQGTAESFGSKTTFNYDPEGGLSYLYDGIVKLRNMEKIGPIATTFIPFARVLTNVFNRFLHWTPVGFITATKSGKSGIKEFVPFSGLKFTTDSNGKKVLKNEASVRVTGGKVRALTSDEKSDLMIKATIGTSTMLTLYSILMKGLDEPDEDQWFKITAAGPTDYKKKYELQKGGWKPFTVSFGDFSFSYKDNPMFFVLVSAGTLYESNKYGNVIEDDLAAYVMGQTAMSMTGQSWLQGIEDLGGLMNREDWDKKVANKLFGTVSSIVIPNFHKQKIRLMMDILDDPIKSRANGTFASAMSQLYRDIPGANSGLYDLVDSMGDPVVPNQTSKYIPFEFALGDDADPVAKVLTDNGIFIGFPSNQKDIFDLKARTKRKMTDDEYQVYKIRAAKETGKILRQRFAIIKNLSKSNRPEVLQDYVANIKKDARQAAYNDVFIRGGYKRYTKK
jgi:hypothetical protein